ncbi:G-type lectin S-receptor-like serine/threonine-protein kinase At4g03230 [Rutidosis leptorrhynchoides]|uniref:G-type lectin S-receptor-like serine/threonine-protein kinase At4g03230 n=1 Tax=Rutidosis leptorrhynchoides TaxID=125765 RepID=UPI003A99C655
MISISARLVLCFFLIPALTYGADTLMVNQSLSGNQTLVSRDANFELGFFKPGKSNNNYIGIWYKRVKQTTIVWVANRDTPISDTSSSSLIIKGGNLVLLNESNTQIWSTSLPTSGVSSASVLLLDDGNLVLRYGSNSSPPIWQSFDHPTQTFLPGSKLGYNKITNSKQVISSWKSIDDPATGLYSLEVDQDQKQYLIKWNNSVTYWTSGSWNDRTHIFNLVPEMRLNYIYNYSYIDNVNESYFTYSLYYPSIISRLVIDVSGQIQQMSWLESSQQWQLFWAQPRQVCDVYARCGAFGICSQVNLQFCSCLPAFKPTSPSDWDMRDFSSGCERITTLNCIVKEEKYDFIASYVPLSFLSSLPAYGTPALDDSECRKSCLNDCTCDAYSFLLKTCWLWNDDNLKNLSLVLKSGESQNVPLNIKVSSSDLPNKTKAQKVNTKVIVTGTISGFLGLIFLCGISLVIYRRVKRQGSREDNRQNLELQHNDPAATVKFLVDPGILSAEDRRDIDVPFYDFKIISTSTDYFSLANKLGQGGFGPVYKGVLPGGAEVAVKRLSSQSGQGLKEFKNEVLLIAKLQHRNLVRLLGYSMKDHEMILLYEYMPNKSLDRFIFDRTLCMRLDWSMRFDIIMGIARGILYLHQDSRLRIIHRDLKASNVLLDDEMNPKISDFGLPKIVKGTDSESSTKRVIGTYGYMAPEYALDGLFSVKSDVFSFGVVVLEIISGKRNTGYYHNQQAFSLVSYAWGLWKDNTPLNLLDLALAESCNSIEVLRCIVIGLLCIQEDPRDRPTMLNVVLMLGMDNESLPDPKEPAFVSKARYTSLMTSSSTSEINQLTITEEQGR